MVKHFNWAVFGNELKWYWTEPQQGNFNYKDADDLLSLCQKHNIETRGHCIFWDVDGTVQQWIKSLNNNDLMAAVQNRLNGLLTRYKGKFSHYDVNNEMLHGSFYQDRLDGCDTRSCPEKYIEHILDLQEQGAPVGGIGIQGHIDSPVGSIVCSSLDKLGILGLPIWFTELDVSSINEFVRADDLEVMLQGDINEAGKRFQALKREWLSHSRGHVDEQGQFNFRGFHGTYNVEVVTPTKKISKTFVLDKGDSPLVVSIDL
ncbi:Glycoside hydrolase family 10 domain [Sesbania bispinosa]|nr:Glycoside hydrolase family 10 domain [Sesbania bispinosa]